jgi:plasmid stabilization system protein ParE
VKVVWSQRAIARAAEIATHIANDRPDAAVAWVDGLFATVGRLKDHPKRGRRVPEVDRPSIREVRHGTYRIIYRVDPSRLVALTVRHGRRQWDPSELRSEE